MGKIMKEGVQYGVGGTQKASEITYDTGTVADALNRIGAENKIRIISVATDNTTVGFRLRYASGSAFQALYFDGTRIALITKTGNRVSSVVEAVGTFASKTCELENTDLRVDAWVRAAFIITSAAISRLDEISIEPYSA